jgi:hypothetical protein
MPDDDNIGEIAEGLMGVSALLEPIIEFAVGLKANLIEQGWSESVAGEVSGEVLKRVIIMGMGGQK